MVFLQDYPNHSLRGQPKGAEQILRERGLLPENGKRRDGLRFRLECLKSGGRKGCQAEENKGLAESFLNSADRGSKV
jgi:hypothetical protein